MQDFAAIDFETANFEFTSICAVGVVVVRGGRVVHSFYSTVRPEPNYYRVTCTRVHGMTYADTDGAPSFPEVWAQVSPQLEGLPLVAHNKGFDEHCLKAVHQYYHIPYPDYQFFCTLRRSLKVWPEGGHTLDIIAARCGYQLQNHHNALADAEACAAIALEIL